MAAEGPAAVRAGTAQAVVRRRAARLGGLHGGGGGRVRRRVVADATRDRERDDEQCPGEKRRTLQGSFNGREALRVMGFVITVGGESMNC